MTDFSETGSRNMAETCAINFLTTVSYSTSSVRGLRQLLLALLMGGGVDLKNFSGRNGVVQFSCFFFNFDRLWNKN